MQWYKLNEGGVNIKPPNGKPLLVYCPSWCDSGYSVATWNGSKFSCETHGTDINNHIEQWQLIFEAD